MLKYDFVAMLQTTFVKAVKDKAEELGRDPYLIANEETHKYLGCILSEEVKQATIDKCPCAINCDLPYGTVDIC